MSSQGQEVWWRLDRGRIIGTLARASRWKPLLSSGSMARIVALPLARIISIMSDATASGTWASKSIAPCLGVAACVRINLCAARAWVFSRVIVCTLCVREGVRILARVHACVCCLHAGILRFQGDQGG